MFTRSHSNCVDDDDKGEGALQCVSRKLAKALVAMATRRVSWSIGYLLVGWLVGWLVRCIGGQ
jgi:hypothetical protein